MTVARDLDPWGHAARAFAASAVRDRWLYDPVAWAHDVIDWRDGGLTAYQEDALSLLAKHRRVAVRGPHGLGKALRLDTPVPTPGGWSTVGQLRPGEPVFDEQGKPCRVVGKSPVWRDDTYEVEFADGTVVTTHANHEWQAVDVYDRPRTPRPERRRVEVDHLAISPAGTVFLPDTKRWSAARPVLIRAGRLLHGNEDVTGRLNGLRHETATVARVLGVPVTPLVVMDGPQLIGPHGRPATQLEFRGILIVPADRLTNHLTSRAHIPGQRRPADLAATITSDLPPYTRRHRG